MTSQPALTVFEPAEDEPKNRVAARAAGADLPGHAGIKRRVRPDGGGRGPPAELLRGAGPRLSGRRRGMDLDASTDLFPHVRADRRFRPRVDACLFSREGGGRHGHGGLGALPRLGDGLLAGASRHGAGRVARDSGDDGGPARGPRGQANRPVRGDPLDDRLPDEQPVPDGLSAISSCGLANLLGPGGVAGQAVQPPREGDGEILEPDAKPKRSSNSAPPTSARTSG